MHRWMTLLGLTALSPVALVAAACSSEGDLPEIAACNEQAAAHGQQVAQCCGRSGTSEADSYRRGCQMMHATEGAQVDEALRSECFAQERAAWDGCTDLLDDPFEVHVCSGWVRGSLSQGQACQLPIVSPCAFGLQCWPTSCVDPNGPKACVAPPSVDEDCHCDRCGADLLCSGGTCVAERSIGAGQDCSGYDGDTPAAICAEGHWCDGSTCVALPEEGDTCSGWCAPGLACTAGTCSTDTAGNACLLHADCPSQACRDGVCRTNEFCSIPA